MKDEPVFEERDGSFVARVYYETDWCPNPREEYPAGKMVCFHKRYVLGDKHDYSVDNYNSFEELIDDICEREDVIEWYNLYLYDHGGVTMSIGEFHDRWDSGQVGVIYMTSDVAKQNGLDKERAGEVLRNEVETYDCYLRGECYRYEVVKVTTCNHGHEHEEVVGACGGYLGDIDWCKQEALGDLKWHADEEREEYAAKLASVAALQESIEFDSNPLTT